MASRKEQRDRARAERERKAAEEAAKARRNKRLMQLGAALAAAAAVVIVAIVISSSGDGGGGGSSKGDAVGSAESAKLLKGIPQRGIELGNPDAPVTMIEFADLQCPFCRDYTEKVFPAIVAKYVRTGKVKMVFRNYAFLGPDSITGARAAQAAGKQNKLYNFVDVFYRNQGEENTNYVTDAFLKKIGGGVSGLDVDEMLTDRADPTIDQEIAEAQQEAQKFGINSTPSFLLQKGDAKPQKLEYQGFEVSQFEQAIDAALGGT